MLFHCTLLLLSFGSLNADSFWSSGYCAQPRIDHGRVRVRNRAKLAKFTCLPGYVLVGNKYATCRNSQWDVPLPVCTRPGCSVPNIENGLRLPNADSSWVMFFCLPGFKLVGSAAIYCDGRRWNSTAPTCVNSTAQSSLSCDFEESLCGWTQDELHDFDWKRLNKKTPSSFLNTGPSFDHTLGPKKAGYYMYIESTSRIENDTARFLSPVLDRALTKNGCFSFFYHMYGRTCGGLRVYQKPDNLLLEVLLHLHSEERKKYILFEKWGNLGDSWYGAVATLNDYEDNFQIIIEGIRGTSFTSDIAIDDVAILQGANCTAARKAASTPRPNPVMPDSCEDRCYKSDTDVTSLGCGCTALCITDSNCCPDFFDVCIFIPDTTLPDDDVLIPNSSDEIASLTRTPTTSLLVRTTPETTSTTTSTTTTTTTSTTTTTTTTTTPKPTTTTPTTTVAPRPKTTRRRTIKTTPLTKTTRPITTSTTYRPTVRTTERVTTTAPKVTNRNTAKPVIVMRTTTSTKLPTMTSVTYGISRTLENHNMYHELVEKAKKENEIQTKKIVNVKLNEEKSQSSSGIKIVIIIIGLLAFLGPISMVMFARSTRGRIAIARLRSRVDHDPEVRFLTSDVDDL